MKILKPGKVEMRKFVCDCCGCEFVATPADIFWIDQEVSCPQEGCNVSTGWEFGEPYEEPVKVVEDDREKLEHLMLMWDSCPAKFGGVPAAAKFLIERGVTFREV